MNKAPDQDIHRTTAHLPPEPVWPTTDQPDWLLDDSSYQAGAFRGGSDTDLILTNDLVRRHFRLAPNAATVGFDNLANGQAILRGVKPEAEIELDGVAWEIGGLQGQPNYAFLRPQWIDTLSAAPNAWQFVGFAQGSLQERLSWKRVRHHAPDIEWPPRGQYLRMDYRPPNDSPLAPELALSIHYELYDGLPLMAKWLSLHNGSKTIVVVNRCTSEILAAVEYSSVVEHRGQTNPPPNIHVETDYSFGGDAAANASIHSVHWEEDPDFDTQVNYLKRTKCLLKVGPQIGPEESLPPGQTFTSCRAFILPFDSFERERNGLAQRRMYRTLAPWATENPLMMHVRFADWDTVKTAIDQCAEVGFELVIMTFGSGFDIENDAPEYLEQMRQYAHYARSKGIELGGYSLLASRSIDADNDVVMPPGQEPTFGHSPCLESHWGQAYFAKLYRFYEQTGQTLLEHDGSYPGDVCASTQHPGHSGLADSQFRQWRAIADFYRWCRARGIYLNVPDYYYLAGSNKSGMGYRETNWSLPRAEQVFHCRQNIYDGTWEKTPSMGWMFVPLTEYHGGGEAATIEPLAEHIDHYRAMLHSNLALGVQACYRGPRLYDTDAVRLMVEEQVTWYKKYRDILESDLIHGRRADGRDLDWMLHVNPRLPHKGMLVIFNPLTKPVERTVSVNLYYTGLTDTVRIRREEGPARKMALSRDYTIGLDVSLEPESSTWYVIE
ncbi:MAG: alpha-galactosidase [Candidatus Latescibacteria bacterium]|nr:alpha-galactosidase [Candidatus Latescibacterota bacterium]